MIDDGIKAKDEDKWSHQEIKDYISLLSREKRNPKAASMLDQLLQEVGGEDNGMY